MNAKVAQRKPQLFACFCIVDKKLGQDYRDMATFRIRFC